MIKRYMFVILLTTLLMNAVQVKQNSTFPLLLKKRIEYIIEREYSIRNLDNILVGIVNYPQWFVSMATGLYNSLAYHKSVKGGEGLYPTNITHDRWMHNFNTHTGQDISICAEKIQGWANNGVLELVMYSQAVNVCLSSNLKNLQDNAKWYKTCWAGYSNKCVVNIKVGG